MEPNVLTDPSLNVKELVELRAGYEAQLRVLNEHWQERFDIMRSKAETAATLAEAGRIDALLQANANNVALALSKQEAQALAQDRRIAVLEQNQYQAGGKDMQRSEGRAVNQWAIGIIVALAAIAGVFLANRL